MNLPTYERLPTPSLGWLIFSRVYVGPDHLLVVDCSGYEERYRRFLFTDIQAILIRRTVFGRVMNLVLGIFGSCLLAAGIATGGEGLVVFGVLAGLLWLLLLVNVLRGPTCSFSIKTRVQLHRIKAFSRLLGTRRCVEQLLPLIQQAQAQRADALVRQVNPIAPGMDAPVENPSSSQEGDPEAST